jgi:hypothetical protein
VVRGCGSGTRAVTIWEGMSERSVANLCKDYAWPASPCFQAQADKESGMGACKLTMVRCMRCRGQGGALVVFEFNLRNLI